MSHKKFTALCSELTPLRERGPFYVGCCPFCDDKNFMWVVNPQSERAHCFACRKDFSWDEVKERLVDGECVGSKK
jgi:DNA primase